MSKLLLSLGFRSAFDEVQDAAKEGLKIVRIQNLLETVTMLSNIAKDVWHSAIEQMDGIHTAIADIG